MSYYKAVAIAEKPLIQWDEWAKDLAELTELGEYDNPLIVLKSAIPENQFGICPWKIVAGELVDRSGAEMDAYEAEYIVQQNRDSYKAAIHTIEFAYFTLHSKNFPMHAAARLRYMAVSSDSSPRADTDFMTVSGTIHTVLADDIDLFTQKYYEKLRELTEPTIP